MNLLERIDYYRRLWELTLPHISAPQSQDVLRWAAYPLDIVESAIVQASHRFSRDRITDDLEPIDTYRYVTATHAR